MTGFNETPEQAMHKAFFNEEGARKAMDARLLMFASAAMMADAAPAYRTMAREDAIVACAAYMDAIEATVIARQRVMNGGRS